jgi:hypothetical protein
VGSRQVSSGSGEYLGESSELEDESKHSAKDSPMRNVRSSLTTLLGVVGLFCTARAEAQPSPLGLARQLDLECRSAQGAPPVQELGIRQLNPVLQNVLPDQDAELGQLEEVCVPVAKNNVIPTQPARDIIRALDLACYRAEAPPVNTWVVASHLNPVLGNLPPELVHLTHLEQVCVPVAKNGVVPPEPIRSVIEHMDFACYGLEHPTANANTNLILSHLNPVLVDMGLQNHAVQMERAKQLCVPIGKEQQVIPQPVKHLVQWIDFLKYNLTPLGAPLPPVPLTLHHLNPLFLQEESFPVVLIGQPRLLVPVAKNNVWPPAN